MRLFVAYTLSVVLVGGSGYLLLNHELRHLMVEQYATMHQADARSIEAAAREAGQRSSLRDVGLLIGAIGERPGVVEAILIDQRHVVRAAGIDRLVGTRDRDSRIEAALTAGASYAGREADPANDTRNFEFVTPVEIYGERYALELSYDHRAFDLQLTRVRRVLGLAGMLALALGAGLFYLVGVMRSHRSALQRATRDGLTDLPNQRAFGDDFGRAVAKAERYQEPLALAIVDLDDFTFLNDRHGHPQGDSILRRIAAILLDGRVDDRAYRIGGDEFALILTHADAEGATVLARRLLRKAHEAGIQVSIGFSALRFGEPADILRAEADAALYEAKRRGGAQIVGFDEIREVTTVMSNERRASVHRLIEEGRLDTVYQPIWDLNRMTLLGVEALTRPHPDYGLSGPAEAFDIAEQIGRVHQLDVLAITSALTIAPQLPDDALLFLNICPQTLDLDLDGNDWLLEASAAAGLPPERIVIEVTERFEGRPSAVAKSLRRLADQGFKIAIDDVGAGNSGLEMLRQVNADYVKLDRSIVAAAATEAGARAILMALATFALHTGAFVIAKGIEDDYTLDILRDLAQQRTDSHTIVQGGQGYGLGKPSPEIDIELPASLRPLSYSA